MKKLWYFFLVASIFTVTACGGSPSVSDSGESADEISREIYRDHQTLTAGEFSFHTDSTFRIDIPEVGLENVFIRDVSNTEKLDANTYGLVYLLADDRYGGGMSTSDHYLAVVMGDTVVVKDLSEEENGARMAGEITLCDLDGDGDCEIVLQETVGGSGGAGQYLSRVFDFSDGGLTKLFSSSEDGAPSFDSGFSATILPGRQLRIDNRFTGYTETFTVTDKTDEYFRFWYDEEENPQEYSLLVDSFFGFVPEDVDGDGVYEIDCRQYTSLIGHSDYTGTAISVLKFDVKEKRFVVADADFERNT